MIITQTNKQTNKQQKTKTATTKKNNRNRIWNKQTCICIVLIQSNEKSLMKFATVSAKTLKTVNCLPKSLYNYFNNYLYVYVCICMYIYIYIYIYIIHIHLNKIIYICTTYKAYFSFRILVFFTFKESVPSPYLIKDSQINL